MNKDEEMKKVSVIIPVYNAEQYLAESLDCIINQTEKNIEIICVDDGSDDKSLSILKNYQEKDSRIKILEQQNKGAGAARNLGILNSNGEYLYFFDADDLCASTLLEKTLKIAEETNADIVAFNGEKFYEDGKKEFKTGISSKNLPRGLKVFSWRDLPGTIIQTVNVVPWNKIIKASFVKDNNIRFEEISSSNDITFSAVCNATADRIAFTEEKLHKYRVGISGSITSSKAKKLPNIIKAVESAERQISALPHYEELALSLKKFVVDNYLFPFSSKDNIPDFEAPIVEDFYNHVHKKFNTDAYKDFAVYYGVSKKYYDFLSIRNSKYSKMKKILKKKVIVSLTSYPARINCVSKVVETIYKQTELPSRVLLYLAAPQFPNKEADLPDELLNFVNENKLEIRWCDEDLRPHKKYFYAMRDFPNDLIVTVDDDLIYDSNTIERLHCSYMANPNCVSANRCHVIAVDDKFNVLPYKYWIKATEEPVNTPSYQLIPIGVGGVLYPASLFVNGLSNKMFNESYIKELCLNADDLWLKTMELVNDIPVVLTGLNPKLKYVEGSQETALYIQNKDNNENDIQMSNIIDWVKRFYNEDLVIKRLKQNTDVNLCERTYLYDRIALDSKSIERLERTNKKVAVSNEDVASKMQEYLETSRIDLKNCGTEKNNVFFVECNDKNVKPLTPAWIIDSHGAGFFIESKSATTDLTVRCKEKGKLQVKLRGVCVRNNERKNIPIFVSYANFTINGKVISKDIVVASHDKPFVYEYDASDEEIIKIHFEREVFEKLNKNLQKQKDTEKKIKEEVQKQKAELDKQRDDIARQNKEIAKQRNELQKLKNEYNRKFHELKTSNSWKVGRVVTFVPRKMKKLFHRG